MGYGSALHYVAPASFGHPKSDGDFWRTQFVDCGLRRLVRAKRLLGKRGAL